MKKHLILATCAFVGFTSALTSLEAGPALRARLVPVSESESIATVTSGSVLPAISTLQPVVILPEVAVPAMTLVASKRPVISPVFTPVITPGVNPVIIAATIRPQPPIIFLPPPPVTPDPVMSPQ